MISRRKLALALASLVAVGVGGLGLAQAGQPSAADIQSGERAADAPGPDQTAADDADEQVGGADAERARRAAVDAIGGGHVVGVEREDERGVRWEVEVVNRDGNELEVELNENFEQVPIDREDASAEADRTDDGTTDDD